MPVWSLIILATLGLVLLIVISGAVLFLWRRWHRSLPTVTIAGGATQMIQTSATLNGSVTGTGGENPLVHIYWGRADAGENPANWEHDENLGARAVGQFNRPIANLMPNTPYFYRVSAWNSRGRVWGPVSSFTTQPAPEPTLEELVQQLTTAADQQVRGQHLVELTPIPAPEVIISPHEVQQLVAFANAVAQAYRDAQLSLRGAQELRRLAQGVERTRQDIERMNDEAVETGSQAYTILGLPSPLERDLRIRELEAEVAEKNRQVNDLNRRLEEAQNGMDKGSAELNKAMASLEDVLPPQET